VIHRHLLVPTDTQAEELPSAAIVSILERGDLADWRPLAEAVARDPEGELAENVMRLIDAYPMYGTSALWRSWIDRRRARAEGAERPIRVAGLSALRRELGLTQVELAGRARMSQSDLSKLERRRDVRVSTLRAYAEALGGRLQILFELGGKKMEIRWPNRADP
jgi:hypothetical protein